MKKIFINFIASLGVIAAFAASSYAASILTFDNFSSKEADNASMRVSWDSLATGSFELKYHASGDLEDTSVIGTNFYQTVLNGLKSNTTYYFKIFANDSDITGTGGSYVTAVTYAMEVTAHSYNPATKYFSWTDSADTLASGYRLLYSKNSDLSYSTQQNFNAGVYSYNASSLTPNTSYYYKLGAKNHASHYNYEKDEYSQDVIHNFLTLPAKPAIGAVSSYSYDRATVSWTLPANAAERGNYYILEASEHSDFSSDVRQTAHLPTVSTYSVITGLSPNKVYYFRVKAVNAAGSVNSDSVSKRTLAPNISTSPNTLNISSDWGSITVDFATLPSAECNGYRLSVSTSSTFTPSNTVSGGTGTNSLTVSGLAYDTLYYVHLITLNNDSVPNITNLGTYHTGTVGAPGNVTFKEIYQSSAVLNFSKIDPAPSHYITRVYNSADEVVSLIVKTPAQIDTDPDDSGTLILHTSDYEGDHVSYDDLSVTNSPLSPNKAYTFEVTAEYGERKDTSDRSAQKWTLPQRVSNFEIKNGDVTYHDITVSFDPYTTEQAASFVMRIYTSDTLQTPIWEQYSEPTDGTMSTDGTLMPNTVYYLNAAMINNDNEGIYELISTTTLAIQPVAVPGSSTTLKQTANTITATLLPNGNPEGTRFRIECSSNSFVNYKYQVGENAAEDQPFTLVCSDLNPSTGYQVRVIPINKQGTESPAALFGEIATNSPKPKVYNSDTVSGANYHVSSNTVRVNWPGTYIDNELETNYPANTRYRIEISSDPENFTNPISLITSNKYAEFSELQSNTTYYAKLRACNNSNWAAPCGGEGTESYPSDNFISTATLPAVPIIAATTYTIVGLNTFTLNWEHGNNSPNTKYEVYTSTVCEDHFLMAAFMHGENFVENCKAVWATNVEGTSYQFRDLARGMTYASLVRAIGVSGVNKSDFAYAGKETTTTSTSAQLIRQQMYDLGIKTSFGEISLHIPPYSFSTTVEIKMDPLFVEYFKNPQNHYDTVGTVDGLKLIPANVGVDIKQTDSHTIFTIESPLTLVLSYDDNDLASEISTSHFALGASSSLEDKRSKLILAYHDTKVNAWNPVESGSSTEYDAELDKTIHKITAKIWNTGVYQIMRTSAEKKLDVKIYPNPYKPNTFSDFVHFIKLPDLGNGVKIKIFTFLGELVKEIDAAGTTAAWDGTNQSGNKVASGVYIVFIQSKDDKSLNKTYKLAVER